MKKPAGKVTSLSWNIGSEVHSPTCQSVLFSPSVHEREILVRSAGIYFMSGKNASEPFRTLVFPSVFSLNASIQRGKC